MALPDFTAYTDEKLEDARLAILNEKERRDRLANAPTAVAQIATRYIEDGGDRAELVAALDGTPAPE